MRAVERASCGFAVVVLLATMSAGAAADKLALDDCVIVVDPASPPHVQYAVEELRAYLQEAVGEDPRVMGDLDPAAGVAILVGPRSAEQILGAQSPVAKLAGDGYILKSIRRDGKPFLIAAGASTRGTKYAVARLMKTLRTDGGSATVDAALDITSQPAFAVRGLHFNGWSFDYPHTFRRWRERDWQQYLDILAYQGINLFYLWPFIEVIPVPLSESDQEYLEECRRVVEYAQQKHGMEVWLMQCTNRVARDRCGVEDPRHRPYWRPAQEDLNPGNPAHYQAIMASREAMYRIIDNADGVCNIDSDPGACPGSPLSDYGKVLRGCRELLDKHNVHGPETKLVNWMWFGWGVSAQHAFDTAHQKRTIESLQQVLPEPWWLISGTFPYLPLCRDMGLLEKTVLLPYGVIELEPCYPATNVQIDAVRSAFDDHIAHYPQLAGVMGNVQTPLLQFPHIYFYTSCMWDLEYRKRSEKEVLAELATHLYPEHSELIADCYMGLKEKDSARVAALADQLTALVEQNQLGRPGIFARKLFPDQCIVAQSLVLQLKLQSAREKIVQTVQDDTSLDQCATLLADYCAAYAAWDTAHGWHTLWGWGSWPLGNFPSDPRYPKLVADLNRALGSPADVDVCFAQVAGLLAGKFDEQVIREGCILPLRRAVHAARPIASLAQHAQASSSVSPNPELYPASAANDGMLSSLYWPGALVENNSQWLQLTWESPQTFNQVIVYFLQHPSMHGRTIRLQCEIRPDTWEDFATAVVPPDNNTPHAVASFQLPSSVTLNKMRVVNLLDLFEIEVR
ncbi:MAG: discoidin domain-containing protein [Pirellulaceae bacterium]